MISSVPSPDGAFEYFTKFREGGQHEMIGRSRRGGSDTRILLDGDALAAQSDYFRFGGAQHSTNHKLQAWSADVKGSEYFTIRVRDWESGDDIADIVEQTGGDVVWNANSTAFFYVKLDDNHRPLQVYLHRIGTPQSQDRLIYEEKDTGWFIHIHESASRRFCVIAGGDHETSEQYLIELSDPTAQPAPGRAARGRNSIFSS